MTKLLFILPLAFLLHACNDKSTVVSGDEVLLFFTLYNSEGDRIDNSIQPNGQMPLRILAGKNYLIKGMDETLIGMMEGETKTSQILPENAYGNKGVYYLDSLGKKIYVIQPYDTLIVKIELLKINKMP
jgi:FKBP-type peptidyl-prolyl cis-trans isomerase